MKLLITTLTIIFVSFGVNGAQNIEALYKYCKIYQNNGFQFKKLDRVNMLKATICRVEIRAMVQEGDANCQWIKNMYQKTNDKFLWGVFAENRANGRTQTTNQVIMAFINFTEKNPELWNESTIFHSSKFLSKKFPCNYKKPN